MREVEQLEVEYGDRDYVSVFVGVCPSRERFEAYMEKDYERLHVDDIGFEMGVDFGINTYDEDMAVFYFRQRPSAQIAELFEESIFDLDELKRRYPQGLDRVYHAVCQLGGLRFEGPVEAYDSAEFGYFKFLGAFKAEWAR